MAARFWAEIDEDWKRREDRALAQRAANMTATREGKPVPYPNPFMSWDPTKVPRNASPSEYLASVIEFRKLCRPSEPKRHKI